MKIAPILNISNLKSSKLNTNSLNFKQNTIPPQKNDAFETSVLRIYYDENNNMIPPENITYRNGQAYNGSKKLNNYRIFQRDFIEHTSRETRYINGYKFQDTRKKRGIVVQEDIYGKNTNERAIVTKFDDFGTFDYRIARNFRFDTKNTPAFNLRKKIPHGRMDVYAELKEKDGAIGYFSARYEHDDIIGAYEAALSINKDGTYSYEARTKEDFKALHKGLSELKSIIQSEDMKSDFGQYTNFNQELDNVLDFIKKELE